MKLKKKIFYKRPIISVIVNCHNGEKFLAKCISSILNQSYKNFEIIFVDNASTDKSKVIIKKINSKKIKYFKLKKKTKLYNARNYALNKTTGNFIAFLDVDDYWHDDKLFNQIKLFKDSQVGFSSTNFWIYNDKKNTKKKAYNFNKPEGRVFEKLASNYSVCMSTLMVRKKVIETYKIRFNNRFDIIGDLEFVLRLSEVSKLSRLHTPYAVYRLTGKNMSLNLKKEIQELKIYLSSIKKKSFLYLKINELIYYKQAIFSLEKKMYIDFIKFFLKAKSYFNKVKLLFYLISIKKLIS